MNLIELFSSDLYNSEEFYKYFCKDEILKIPFELFELIDVEQQNENKYIFPNIIEFFTDMYVTLNIKQEDFEYIDSKLQEIDFCKKFSEYLYSDYLDKKQGAILVFAKMRKTENCKYLEEAFINEYYKKNPILTSTCLKELYYLKSSKAAEYEKLILEEKDLINFISIMLVENGELNCNVLELYKDEDFFTKIKSENFKKFDMEFETFIINVQGANKIKDFTRDEYIKSFYYFEKIYGSYKVEDFYSFYKNALQEIKNST